MAEETGSYQAPLAVIEQPLNLVPVVLKEAALDSPTFRAANHHFSEQISIIETWLESYSRACSKLVTEVASLESTVNAFLAQSAPPSQISEAVLDHDYTVLAMKRYGEGAREFWNYTLRGVKKYETLVVEPIRQFLQNDLRMFKEARRNLESAQKTYDTTISRYLGQSKTKEASSLREDAFQLHEYRKAYLKACMDYSTLAPQLRTTLDKLIVRVFVDQWKEMRSSREANDTLFKKWGSEMDRVKGWSKEMENGEKTFKRELMLARKQLEDAAELNVRPSRELDDYSASTVPFLGAGPSSQMTSDRLRKIGKQGWLMMKSVTGKPARTVWNRRWFYVQNGIFGWLVQGTRSGGVEESEKYGVLLCSVRPAFQEERRFCFEVKTKDQTMIVQAETQQELVEWLGAFEAAKRNALENPASAKQVPGATQSGMDPAFSISPPVAPELAAKAGDGQTHEKNDDNASLTPFEKDGAAPNVRPSFDIRETSARRVMSLTREIGNDGESGGGGGFREGSKEHASRLMQKLDLHKRSVASPTVTPSPAGGIASLISASHNIMPVGPAIMSSGQSTATGLDSARRTFTMPSSTLAPSTLANPPAATSLSHTAVVVSGERGFGLGGETWVPSGIMANLWGSTNWGYINRLGDDTSRNETAASPPSTIRTPTMSRDDSIVMEGQTGEKSGVGAIVDATQSDADLPSSNVRHRKTISLEVQAADKVLEAAAASKSAIGEEDFPNYYPLPLKAQQAQFRILFPSAARHEKVVLVFRATWNPNERQEFPGRVYVTTKDIYFYSNHLGLVLVTSYGLSGINDVTAAPGRDCDFLYLHLTDQSSFAGIENAESEEDRRRITIKTFLEPLRLLQRRLNYLARNANADEPDKIEDVLKNLIKMEVEEPKRSSSMESWEDVTYSPNDDARGSPDQNRRGRNIRASLRIDGTLGYGDDRAKTGREVQKFRLPGHPVKYTPKGMETSVVRDFNVSAKALFHVIFGDKSAVFQLLYANRWAEAVTQTPWVQQFPSTEKDRGNGHWVRQLAIPQGRGTSRSRPQDIQTIEILNDHLCYVVANVKRPWHLPYNSRFSLVTKIVITHVAKSRCKLGVYQRIAWQKPPATPYVKKLIDAQSLKDLEADALDLSNVAFDQVSRLGNHSKTNRAVEIFGNIGQQTQVAQIDPSKAPPILALASNKSVKTAVTRTVFSLIAQDATGKVMAFIGILVELATAMAKGILNVFTAHTFLVLLLATSVLYNSWYGYRDGLSWWHDRSTSMFMARMGVTPKPTLSRAIYLHDVEDIILPHIENDTVSSIGLVSDDSGRTCRTTFGEQLIAPDTGIAVNLGGTAWRLQRTRDSLAHYRHDLMVALRVVNRVERDVVLAEWENWVKSEDQKCTKIERMLKQKKSGKLKSQASGNLQELGDDFAQYCESCKQELSSFDTGTTLI